MKELDPLNKPKRKKILPDTESAYEDNLFL